MNCLNYLVKCYMLVGGLGPGPPGTLKYGPVNQPTNADTISCWITQLRHGTVKRLPWFTNLKNLKTSHFVLSRRHASFDFHKIRRDDRSGPFHHFTTKLFLGLFNSLADRGHRKFGWKRPHRDKLFIILSLIELKLPNLTDLCRLRKRINPINFVRIVQGTRPLWSIILVKFDFFKCFWGLKPTSLNLSRWNLARKSGHIFRLYLPNFTLIDRCNVSPLRGEKPKNRSFIVKTTPAELPCGQFLPVTRGY